MRHLPNYYQEFVSKLEDGMESDHKADKNVNEKQQLIEVLRETGGNQTRAAKILGVNRMTVLNRMRKYGISSKKVFETSQ